MAKILLVEDEAIIRDAFEIILSSSGHDLDVAINGAEALELWNKSRYDLLLLDLMMPVLDGLGFLREAQIKESAAGARVVVLSNLSSGEATVEALQLGAHRHEVKANLAPSELLKLVEQELSQRRTSKK